MQLTNEHIQTMSSSMILSIVNTALRNHYSSLADLIDDWNLDESLLKDVLHQYAYDPSMNQFK